MLELFRNYEDMYYQQLEGVDIDVWRGLEVSFRDINGYPGVPAQIGLIGGIVVGVIGTCALARNGVRPARIISCYQD